MKYPTIEEVESADRVQLATWSRFCGVARNEEELIIINRICARFKEAGVWNAELSKQVGHTDPEYVK